MLRVVIMLEAGCSQCDVAVAFSLISWFFTNTAKRSPGTNRISTARQDRLSDGSPKLWRDYLWKSCGRNTRWLSAPKLLVGDCMRSVCIPVNH